MKACVYNPQSEGLLELIEIDKPQIKEGSALVKVLGVGVCGSDLLKLDRALVKPGTILGHELVGEIIEAPKDSKFELGDKIISSHHVPCGKCKFCLNEQESLCTQFKKTNFNPGAFCEYLELSADHLKYTVEKVPEFMTDIEASFTEPLACCIKAIERSGLQKYRGDQARVLILGLGSIGLMIGQLVKYYFPNLNLVGCDLLQTRLDLAKDLGFDELHENLSDTRLASPEKTELTKASMSISKDEHNAVDEDLSQARFDFIFLCAGADASLDMAVNYAENGATLVVFSSVKTDTLGFNNNDIYYKELTVLGSYSPNLNNLKESLELISNKDIKVDKLITHTTNLENLGKTIEKARQEKGIKVFLKN